MIAFSTPIQHREPKTPPINHRGTSQRPSQFTLNLSKVLGNTGTSSNCFDSALGTSFATCAGSTAVIHHLDENLDVRQQIFRAIAKAPLTGLDGSGSPINYTSQSRPHRLGSGINFAEDSPGGRNAFPKLKTVSCLSLSSDGRLLAVGESGHLPHVSLYDTSPNRSDQPIVSVSEHVSGVRCVKFSPDARWLCSIGDDHDGCIYLWSFNQGTSSLKLHSSNKCSGIYAAAWIGLNSIITVGIRSVKIYRKPTPSTPSTPNRSPTKSKFRLEVISSPGPRVLQGRNAILGSLVEATFTSVCEISDSMAAIGSENGDICILRTLPGTQKLESVIKLTSGVTCLATHNTRGSLVVASRIELSEYRLYDLSRFQFSKLRSVHLQIPLLSISPIQEKIMCVDVLRRVNLLDLDREESHVNTPSHSSAVLGTEIILEESKPVGFVTYEANGTVLSWELDGTFKESHVIALGNDETLIESNELRVLRLSKDVSFFISGDKRGMLR